MNPRYETAVVAARCGDGAALEDLFALLIPKVNRVATRAVDDLRRRSWFHALYCTGDVVQDILLAILRNLGGLPERGEAALGKYLSVVSRNRVVDAIRFHENTRRDDRRFREECVPLHTHHTRTAGPEQQAITREQIGAYREVLATFSARDQSLLRERLENEVPFDELADRLGYASGDSARKAFHTARARLVVRLRG